ncbi:MAG: hypothetical protein HEQ32_04090 [Vampirovibrio sp.]
MPLTSFASPVLSSTRLWIQSHHSLYRGLKPTLRVLLLSIFSALSPAITLIKDKLALYIDIAQMSRSPELAYHELNRFWDLLVLHPALVQVLQITLSGLLIVHLVYMFVVWQGIGYVFKSIESHVEVEQP